MTIESSQKAAVAKYIKSHYDRIDLRVPKGFRDEIKAAADAAGLSVNSFVLRSITEQMQRDIAASPRA